MRTWLAIFIAGLLAASTRAQQVELQVESRTLMEGETTEMTLTCTNTGEPTAPQFQVPDGLELKLVSPNPARSSMVSLINGQRSEKTSYVFSLRLTGVKAGSYTLGSISVEAGGITYQTDPLSITVTKPAEDAVKDGDKLVFAHIGAQPISLYVTQTIEATLTLAIRKYERDGQPLDIGNMLNLRLANGQPVVEASGPDLSVFGTRFGSSEITLNDSAGKRHTYEVYKQTKEIRAEQVGTMKIGPVFFKVNYPVSLRQSLFGGYQVAQSRRETARAPAIEIEVKGPPAENRPADFAGAIGQYEFSVAAKPTRVEQGQPITLIMTIKGDPLEGVTGPDLKKYPELTARFDFTSESSPGDKESGGRVFRRAIFPRREGEQNIPSISWSYFDPSTQKYVTLTSPPIPITVDPPSSPETISETGSRETTSGIALTKTTGGISPNVIDAGLVLQNQDLRPRAAVVAAVAATPPVLCFAIIFLSWRSARLRGDARFARRRSARRSANARISKAARQAAPSAQLHELAESLTGFISDHFGLPPGALTPADARQIVETKTGDANLASALSDFLASCDMARFAGRTVADSDPTMATRRVKQFMDQIEKAAP